MKILQVAPLEEKVPPQKYGGTELIVSNITEELVRRGHDVTLFASGDSKTSAKLFAPIEKSVRNLFNENEMKDGREFWLVNALSTLITLIDELRPDVIHSHVGWPLVTFADRIYKEFHIPILTTLHGPLSVVQEKYAYSESKTAKFVSISNNQRKALPNINYINTVYNGIDLNIFNFNPPEVLHFRAREYFSFLGRISPEKGLHELCEMIKKTNEKLVIAAKVDVMDQKYFDEEILPFIDGEQIKFIGEVDHEGKNKLLKNSKGLLMWLNWEEPFGLVTIEANACGTPVIVNRRGAMPEIIQNGVNGFLVDSLDEMQQKLSEVQTIDPQVCRNIVEEKFSVRAMVDGYENVYEQIKNYER